MGKFVETMYDAITQGMEKEFPQRVAFRYYTEETDTVTTVLFKELAQDVRRTVTYLQSTIPEKELRDFVTMGDLVDYLAANVG